MDAERDARLDRDDQQCETVLPAQRGETGLPAQRGETVLPAQRGEAVVPAPAAETVLPMQRGIRDAARGEIVARHARLQRNGRPVFCTPSRDELAGRVAPRQGRGTNGKVIYSTREDAEAAARELEELGSRNLRAYRCNRSRSGHFHLTTDSAHRPQLPLHLRIPQQQRRDDLSA